MLNVSVNDIIYSHKILIHDEHSITPIAKKHKLTEYYIKFAESIPTTLKNAINNNKFLTDPMKFIGNSNNIIYDSSKKILTNNNICLFKTMSYTNTLELIRLNFTDSEEIYFKMVTTLPKNMLLYKKDSGIDFSKFHYKFENENEDYSEINNLKNDLCVISDIPFEIYVIPLDATLIQIINTTFLPLYDKFVRYVLRLQDYSIKNNMVKANVTEASVLFTPVSDVNDFPVTNIIKLFNLIHLQHKNINGINVNVSKTYLHSNDLDMYLQNDRPMCYVRVNKDATTPFKYTNIETNMFSMYIGERYGDVFTFVNVNFYKYGGIKFNFQIHDTDESFDKISEMLIEKATTYFKSVISQSICFSDCVISPYYNVNNYSVDICNVCGNCIIPNVKYQALNDVVELLQYKQDLKLNYKMKTTIQMMMMCSQDIEYNHAMDVILSNQDLVHKDKVITQFAPQMHINFTNDSIIFNIKDAYSYNMFALHIILMNLTINDKHRMSKTKVISTDYNVKDLKELIKNAIKYPKQNLKMLQKEDPELFGNRITNKGEIKAYSNLCQKPEQRPIIISKVIYDELLKDSAYNNSIIALKNQSFNDKMIYLMCPDKTFNVINFHSVPNQKCIIRCTTQLSNKSQYAHCTEQLGAKTMKATITNLENQMIIKYNPLLTIGRKCQLPEDIADVFMNYILVSFSILNTENIIQKCRKMFNAVPFIIRRNEEESTYEVLTNDATFEEDTVLLLCSNVRPQVYFYFIRIDNTNMFLNLKGNTMWKALINKQYTNNNQFMVFFKYITSVIQQLMNYDEFENTDQNLEVHFKNLYERFDITYVLDPNENDIVGILYDNTLYFTPRYTYGTNVDIETHSIRLGLAISRINNGMYHFPDYTDLAQLPYPITQWFKDQNTGKAVMITINNYELLIQPTDIPEHLFGVDVITFDYTTFIKTMIQYKKYNDQEENKKKTTSVNVASNTNIKTNNENASYKIFNVITYFAQLCYYSGESINIDNIRDLLKKYNTYTTEASSISLIPISNDGKMSWSKSKISEETLQSYFTYYNNNNYALFIKLITKLVESDFIMTVEGEEDIQSKIITQI